VPAKRPGYVEFTKTLYDALLAAPLTHSQLKVALVIVRYTLGHRGQRDGAKVSVRWIARCACLNELTVRRAVNALLDAGVVCCPKPSVGRRPAVLVMEYDPSRWSWLSPACPKTTPKRAAAGFVVRAQRHAQDSESDHVVRAPEHDVCVLSDTHKPPLCVLPSTDSESRSDEARTLKDGASAADAPPPSTERPRSFLLLGYGDVYEHDTWALKQPDARAQYVKTFGLPSRKGARK